MAFRRRRRPTPEFGIPPPYKPLTGEYAPLRDPGIYPFCGLFQVTAEDTHEDYLVCQGFDPRIKKFVEYDAGDLANKPGIPIGKPFGSRTTGLYLVGHVLPAMIPYTKLGQTPGDATDVSGHPAGLDDVVEILYDDGGDAINWMVVGEQLSLRRIEMTGSLSQSADANGSAIFHFWEEENSAWNETLVANVYNTRHGVFSKPETEAGDAGADGWAVYSLDLRRWDLVWLDMPGLFFATLDANLAHTDASREVTVTDVIAGYDLWGVNYGSTQLVYNPVTTGGLAGITYWHSGNSGDSVLCRYDAPGLKFWIVDVEPNVFGWADQAVDVDGVPNAITMKLPPWNPAV